MFSKNNSHQLIVSLHKITKECKYAYHLITNIFTYPVLPSEGLATMAGVFSVIIGRWLMFRKDTFWFPASSVQYTS